MLAEGDGVVTKVSANRDHRPLRQTASVVDYTLTKFARSNQGTCINQQPIVNAGERVHQGRDHLADGPSTCNGEIALGTQRPHRLHDLGRLQLRGRRPAE